MSPNTLPMQPLGYQQVTVSTTAVPLGTVPAGAVVAVIQTNQPIRWRDDGTNPTAAIGMLIAANGTYTYEGAPSAIKAIRQGASDATVDVSFYG